MLKISAAALTILASGTGLPAYSAPASCQGELTLERLAGGDCLARIPLPSARPAAVEAAGIGASTAREWEFTETPGLNPGETRLVRLVGPRFLPDQDQEIDFRARSAENVDFVNAAFQQAITYFGLASEPAAPVEQLAETEARAYQEARVIFGVQKKTAN